MVSNIIPPRQELVPSYEDSPRDARATSYRLSLRSGLYELHCELTGEIIRFPRPDPAVTVKGTAKTVECTKTGLDSSASSTLATISPILKKKMNLRHREPFISLASHHGITRVSLFRGNYCGFTNPTKDVEFYWQLRSHDDGGQNARFRFKDAVLRRTVTGQLSTMTAMYVPYDQAAVSSSSSSVTNGTEGHDDESVPQYEKYLGRLLVRSELDEYDRDLALISFIAVFVRIIEAEKKIAVVSGFVRALTIGET